ncbi:alpha/beta hydrolase [Streptomyces sp. ACA25]|uniref:alpha/beta fold hydrolase n=1 Tax=Streptomyces sp. ACA25 TaxID=3022596 RepID=UPI0023076965|nr:alpha/beta hydrolase [Streptomyces sp. ACA25]MDB1086869.1 alpha/beta hydrolase [Streptomyces sp. ACA25]
MSRPPFIQPPGGVRARRLPTRRGEFAVLDAGPGADPSGTALLVPGYTGSKEDFIALLGPLAAAGYRAVAVDGRGQFETPGPAERAAYRLGALAEDVLAQAAELREHGPVHLVGHSLGGLISRGAVLRAAAHGRTMPFASLTLMSSGPGRITRRQRWKVRMLCGGLPVLGPSGVWRVWNPVAEENEVTDFLRQRWLAGRPAQLRTTGRTLRREPDRVDRLAAAGLPVHVLSGERDEAWPVPAMDEMAQRLNAHRSVIKGAEHSPNVDRPVATATAMLDFWAGVGARS